jgi:hypothetical protein
MEPNIHSNMPQMDTLRIYERLKKANAGEELAKEVAELFRETAEERLASKNDLKNTEAALKTDVKNTELRLQNDLEKTKIEFKNELKQTEFRIKSELEAKIAQSKAEIIKWVAGLLLAQTGVIAALVKLL